MIDLFDATDFDAIRDALENRVGRAEAQAALGPFERFLEASVDPRVVIDYRPRAKLPTPDQELVYEGWDGWLAHWREWFTAWATFEGGERELIEIDDEHVVVCSVDRVIGRTSGIELEYTPAGVWTVVAGRITSYVGYDTREEALAAARS
jgi:hypothetical protein